MEGCKDRGQIRRDREMNGMGVYDVKFTKIRQKVKKMFMIHHHRSDKYILVFSSGVSLEM